MGNSNINSLFFCGCSFTYGEELDESIRELKNFAGLLGTHYGVKVFNHAKPAGSNGRIVRKLFTELPKILDQKFTPMVVIAWTQYHRKEIFDVEQNCYRNVDVPGRDMKCEPFDIMYHTQYSNDAVDALQTLIAKLSVQSFLKTITIPYVFIEAFASVPKTPEKYLHLEKLLDKQYIIPTNLGDIYKGCEMGPGRHPLEQGHQMIADYLISSIDIIHKGAI